MELVSYSARQNQDELNDLKKLFKTGKYLCFVKKEIERCNEINLVLIGALKNPILTVLNMNANNLAEYIMVNKNDTDTIKKNKK